VYKVGHAIKSLENQYMFAPYKSISAQAAFFTVNGMIPYLERGDYESAAGNIIPVILTGAMNILVKLPMILLTIFFLVLMLIKNGRLDPASILQVDRHTGSALLLPNFRRINIIEGSGSFLR
jgi:hypothetical protein